MILAAILASAVSIGDDVSPCRGADGALHLCVNQGVILTPVEQTSSALLFSAPPCGTPEAAKADRCIKWKVSHCPEQPPSFYPSQSGPIVLAVPAMPIGCEDTWRGWRR
jgi:hypothetical protein